MCSKIHPLAVHLSNLDTNKQKLYHLAMKETFKLEKLLSDGFC